MGFWLTSEWKVNVREYAIFYISWIVHTTSQYANDISGYSVPADAGSLLP